MEDRKLFVRLGERETLNVRLDRIKRFEKAQVVDGSPGPSHVARPAIWLELEERQTIHLVYDTYQRRNAEFEYLERAVRRLKKGEQDERRPATTNPRHGWKRRYPEAS